LARRKNVEPKEVANILACLRFVSNPYDADALSLLVKGLRLGGSDSQSKGMSDKTFKDVLIEAERKGDHLLDVMIGITEGAVDIVKPRRRKSVMPYVELVQELRDMAMKNVRPSEIILRLLQRTNYVASLRSQYPLDWKARVENINELLGFARYLEDDNSIPSCIIRPFIPDDPTKEGYPLRLFLQSYVLASPAGCTINAQLSNADRENGRARVTIATCHVSKGLQWPVVMVPSVDKSTYSTEEERRVLYVACTRAQALLYLTYTQSRGKILSPFISECPNKDALFQDTTPDLNRATLSECARVLGRTDTGPGEESVKGSDFKRTPSGSLHSDADPWYPFSPTDHTAHHLVTRLHKRMVGLQQGSMGGDDTS